MAKKVINYEDDIFFLNLTLKSLMDGLKLDIDPSFFAYKVHQDIIFISNTLNNIYKSLSTNEFMFKRLEYLKNLQRLMIQFSNFVNEILSEKCSFSEHLTSYFNDYKAIGINCDNNIKVTRSILADVSSDSMMEETLVSQEEFKFLLKSEEEETG